MSRCFERVNKPSSGSSQTPSTTTPFIPSTFSIPAAPLLQPTTTPLEAENQQLEGEEKRDRIQRRTTNLLEIPDLFKPRVTPVVQRKLEMTAPGLTHVVQQGNATGKIQRQLVPSTASSSTTTNAPENNVNWDAIVQTELEQFLNRFSNIQVQIKWMESTATQCVEKSEPVSVHPPYFINIDNARTTKALKNRREAGKEVKDLLGEIARPQGHKRGGMGMSRTLVGKSTPEDIQAILQQAIDRNLVKPPHERDKLNADDLHDWLVKYGIGVDCSGFVSQALNQVMMRIVGGPLAPNQYIHAGSGGLKGGTAEFDKVKSPAELRPGDTMHIPGHIRIVTSVQTTPEGYIQFTTAESSSVDDIGPTANVWCYESSANFKGLKRKKGDDWVAGDTGKTVTFGRYKVLHQATEPATTTTGTPTFKK